MGINYYTTVNHCDHCKRLDRDLHIGKSSHGWSFTFRAHTGQQLTSWPAWKEFLKNCEIRDEDNRPVSYDWFVNYIETEKSPNYIHSSGHKNLNHHLYIADNSIRLGDASSNYSWQDCLGYAFVLDNFS